jgi:hypothetical protein
VARLGLAVAGAAFVVDTLAKGGACRAAGRAALVAAQVPFLVV